MASFLFSAFKPSDSKGKPKFDQLLDLFLQMMVHTSGDVAEALDWMNQIDRKYQLTDGQYGMGDFIEDLKNKGYLEEDAEGQSILTPKSEQQIRKSSLNEIFGKLKKGKTGQHKTPHKGNGDELGSGTRPYSFGDGLDQISMTDSLRNAQIHHGLGGHMTDDDLEVVEKEHTAQTSTVLMIDISHSMILYGEDRITPAKKVAMALAEYIKLKYPKDTLDILVFGNDARQIHLKDLPYLQVGPFHTNTVAGLEMAMDLLRRRKNKNKQIFMITDGKPTCLKEGISYYKNSFGLDRKIVDKTLTYAAMCRKLHIPITTFMIASDPYLKKFVQEFTEVNQGKAYYSSLDRLGQFMMEDFQNNRKKST